MIKTGNKLLIVDDNIDFVGFVRRVLERENYQISIALDGKTAVERACSEHPELILLDLKLPDISGEEVLEKVKGVDKNIAVVVITGYGKDQVAIDLMRKGAIDFLTKPVEPQILIKAIQNALEIRESQLGDKQIASYPSLEKFFPFLAHEIRNPLHAISGALTIIKRRSDLKDHLLAQSVKIIDEEVQHLNNFVQECLDFVRPPNAIRITEIDIHDVISVVVNITTQMFVPESKKIKVTLEREPTLPKIYANYEEIKQAFLNITKNAFEAMPDDHELFIKTSYDREAPSSIDVWFKDNGEGIRKENLPYLFSPFFTTKQRGTGLGLAICRRIIEERHRGKIEILSEENSGVVVKVKLPVLFRSGDQ